MRLDGSRGGPGRRRGPPRAGVAFALASLAATGVIGGQTALADDGGPVALGSRPADSGRPGPSGRGVPAANPAWASPLALEVRSDTPALDRDALRLALEDELQWYVVPVDPAEALPASVSRISVDVRAMRGELVVRYDEPGRRPLLRVIPAPSRPEATIRTVTWLVGNLVRDQATDLMGADEEPRAAPQPPPPASASAPEAGVLFAPISPPPPPADESPTHEPAAAVARAQASSSTDRYALVTASVFYPLATNAGAPRVRTHLSLNLIYGRVGALDRGLQLGVANAVLDDVDGLQLAVLFNHAGGDVRGLQIAAGVNQASSNVRGVQAAFGSNHAFGDVDGVQLAAINTTHGHVRGAQSGVVNIAGDVSGMQIGLVNVGDQVHGVQLGLVNVSDDIRGVPIGLINVSRTGGVHPAVWTSGSTQLAVGVKFATRNVYTLFSGATQVDRDLRLYGPGLALGLRVPLPWRLIFETDLGGTYLFGGPLRGVSRRDGMRDDLALASWRLTVNAELHRRLTLFAGAALTSRMRFFQTDTQDFAYDLGPDFFAGVQL